MRLGNMTLCNSRLWEYLVHIPIWELFRQLFVRLHARWKKNGDGAYRCVCHYVPWLLERANEYRLLLALVVAVRMPLFPSVSSAIDAELPLTFLLGQRYTPPRRCEPSLQYNAKISARGQFVFVMFSLMSRRLVAIN